MTEASAEFAPRRYRKRPVEVLAVQFDGTNYDEVFALGGVSFNEVDVEDGGDDPTIVAEVFDTLHSTWVGVHAGDWIIKGVKGEHYPCDPEVFEQTYEPVAVCRACHYGHHLSCEDEKCECSHAR